MILQCHSNCNLCRHQLSAAIFSNCLMFSSFHERTTSWRVETVGGSKTVTHLIHQGAQDPSSSLLWLIPVVDSSAVFFLSHFRISIAERLIVAAEEIPCRCRARHRYTIYMGARILHTTAAAGRVAINAHLS